MSDTEDDPQKDVKKTDKTTESDSPSIVGYSPSDDKHFIIPNTKEKLTDQIKDKQNKTERRRSKEYSPTRSLEFKMEPDSYKSGRKNKAFNKENKDITRVKEGKKKISIDVPDSDLHLCSKETNINICNSNPSTESSKEMVPSGQTSPKCTYLSQLTDKDGIKVIKGVGSSSDVNEKPHNKEQKISDEIQIKKSKIKRSRNSIEQQIETFRKNDKQLGEFKTAHYTIIKVLSAFCLEFFI